MLNANDLAQFIGSENFYRWLGIIYTDGVKYVADSAGAYWLIDAIASHQSNRKIKANQSLQKFQVWKLEKALVEDWLLTCSDGNSDESVIVQRIEFSDFPLPEIKFYLEEGWVNGQMKRVLMLPSER